MSTMSAEEAANDANKATEVCKDCCIKLSGVVRATKDVHVVNLQVVDRHQILFRICIKWYIVQWPVIYRAPLCALINDPMHLTHNISFALCSAFNFKYTGRSSGAKQTITFRLLKRCSG